MSADSHRYERLAADDARSEEPSVAGDKPRPWLLWASFAALGAAVLLPFNALITPSSFYRALAPQDATFVSSLVTVYNLCSILGGIMAIWTSNESQLSTRIRASTILLAAGLVAMAGIAALAEPIEAGRASFRELILVISASLSIAGAFLQTSVVGLCASFASIGNEQAMGSMLTGQGLVGLLLSIVQTAAAVRQVHRLDSQQNVDFPTAQRAAVSSFVISAILMILSGCSFYWIASTNTYRQSQASVCLTPPEDQHSRSIHATAQELWDTQREVVGFSVALAYVFAITLAIFPSLVSQVHSSRPDSLVARPVLFTAAAFTLFNLGDVMGRFSLALSPKLILRSPRVVYGLSAARTLFIPAFKQTNWRSTRPSSNSIFTNDWAFFGSLVALGVSNGWLSSSIFVAGPTSVVKLNRRPVAAALLSWALTIGLSIGSIASYYMV